MSTASLLKRVKSIPFPTAPSMPKALDSPEKMAARDHVLEFSKWTKPDYLVGRPHLILCHYLDQLIAGTITRLMVFMPRRHGKSELVSRRLPAYFLGRFPDSLVMAASYSDALASRMNRDCQRIIDSRPYQELFPETRLSEKGSKLKGAVRTDDYFEVVGRGGSYRSAGIGGSIVGMGFDLGIVDDYCRNHADAYSPTLRDKVDEWYSSAFWSCQHPGARILLTCTRWHEDDLAGRLLKAAKEDPEADQWTVVTLPGIATEELHPMDDRQPGDALWPERYGTTFFAKARATLGPTMFDSMVQQSPTTEGGNHFKAWWFRRRWADGGSHWHVQDGRGDWERYAKTDCQVFVICDPASSKKRSADKTAVGAFTITPHNDLLMLDLKSGRWGLEAIIPTLQPFCNDWRASWAGFEADGFQVSLVNAARQTTGFPPCRALSHRGKGKLVRATPAIIKAGAGGVILPEKAEWISPFIDQLTRFTGEEGEDDDEVDVLAYAVMQAPGIEPNDPKIWKPEPEVRNTEPQRTSNAGRHGLFGRSK